MVSVSAQPIAYGDVDHEAALKYAVQLIDHRWAQVIEGRIVLVSPMWDHEKTAARIRRQLDAKADELGCIIGSGNLDLPGSPNWYIPDLAVLPQELAEGAGALLPHQTLLVVEVTSESNGETDRVVKRKRYAQYGAPLYLLADRQDRTCTLFAEPHDLGYAVVDGPHPFGAVLHLPAPFDLALDTTGL
ncbi:Uma2 family endonuclease [Kitasatospora sp. NBC_01287]|uniref:Uma2 family endonuclease n=1 Tax=Kitasatospora sp. NBC_01287 TaxID=2903573 RepID=UPI0022506D08|nr:Uma2 family endonuclease [Kitasatospora sp. NBC_01287]MCX4747203.1 Uma2 family endonuclease [Kitasatospora sp. NBC_01287]